MAATLGSGEVVAQKKPGITRGFLIRLYLLAVLSRKGRLVAVVDVTVMSPLAVMVYTLPPMNDTSALVMAFVADPVYRVLN